MSSIANSAVEPNYLTRLALNSAPFNNSITEPASFFHGEQIEQRLNLLLHLLRASDKVPCVVAPPGGGKSALLSQLKHSAGDELRICHIEASSSLTAEVLIEQSLSAFGVDKAEINQTKDFKSLLKNRLQRLIKLNIRPVLMVDNCDFVNAEQLAVISECLSWQGEEGFLLQAVLTASKVMPEWSQLNGRSQRVDLPNISEQELPHYLMHRLVAAGYVGEMPFSQKDLKYFYRQSKGLPAKINQFAHQKLLGISKAQSAVSFNPAKLLALLKWIALGFLVISLISLLIFQKQINALFSENAHQIIDEEIAPLPFNEEDEALATVIVEDDKITSSDQAGRDELTSLVANLPVDDEMEPISLSEPVIELELQDIDAETLQEKSDSIEKIVPPEPIKAVSSPMHREDWIQEQQASNYTFQLMGSWEHSIVEEFIDKYALTGEVAEFESMRNGRVWYALIYGVYPDKKTALTASKNWPAPLNTLPSWLRRFGSVQKQIRDKAQAQ